MEWSTSRMIEWPNAPALNDRLWFRGPFSLFLLLSSQSLRILYTHHKALSTTLWLRIRRLHVLGYPQTGSFLTVRQSNVPRASFFTPDCLFKATYMYVSTTGAGSSMKAARLGMSRGGKKRTVNQYPLLLFCKVVGTTTYYTLCPPLQLMFCLTIPLHTVPVVRQASIIPYWRTFFSCSRDPIHDVQTNASSRSLEMAWKPGMYLGGMYGIWYNTSSVMQISVRYDNIGTYQ